MSINEPTASAPTDGSPKSRSNTRSTSLRVAASISAALSLVFLALWLGARSDLAATEAERDRLATAEAQRLAEVAALPDIFALADKHLGLDAWVTIDGDETYASVSIEPLGLGDVELPALLDDLGFPPSTMSKIGNTRALDGTLTADAPHVTASWTYHPDDGLSLVFERKG
jgi:hypothetical protein